MFPLKSIASALACISLAAAAPTESKAKSELASPIVTVCTGTINPRAGCADIPVVADTCVDFIGGLTFLDDNISNGQVPFGFGCTFFANFGCLQIGGNDAVFLHGGTYSFFNVPGLAGPINFNDMISSFNCSPVFYK